MLYNAQCTKSRLKKFCLPSFGKKKRWKIALELTSWILAEQKRLEKVEKTTEEEKRFAMTKTFCCCCCCCCCSNVTTMPKNGQKYWWIIEKYLGQSLVSKSKKTRGEDPQWTCSDILFFNEIGIGILSGLKMGSSDLWGQVVITVA